MQLLSVNIGRSQALEVGSKTVRSGIVKTAMPEPVHVGALGLRGDQQADLKHHGGPDQAVYLYSAEDYAWWSAELGRDLAPGTFGENLTLSSFGPEPLEVGDRFRVGEVLLEATSPRIPCGKLGARLGDETFVKRFSEAGRTGVYTRVLREGYVQAGQPVEREARGSGLSLLEFFRLCLTPKPAPEAALQALAAPIDERSRRDFEAYLARRSPESQAEGA